MYLIANLRTQRHAQPREVLVKAAETAIAKLRHVLPDSGAFLICAPVHKSDNHLTARVFEGVGDGAYVGGIHWYLDDRDPTFEAKKELDEGDVKFSKRYNNWNSTTFSVERLRSDIWHGEDNT
ncbi:hypothetical protein BDZ97DRAFT_1766048 [Flammula alnicola]|nr:hypothetical protein BDZ97DRAFT_1766048 [Flammula alnicola]